LKKKETEEIKEEDKAASDEESIKPKKIANKTLGSKKKTTATKKP